MLSELMIFLNLYDKLLFNANQGLKIIGRKKQRLYIRIDEKTNSPLLFLCGGKRYL